MKSNIDYLNRSLERSQTTITQIDEILRELFGVTHDIASTPDEFKGILREKVKHNQSEIEKLNFKAEKYRKAFEVAKQERDSQICEYQNKIDGMALEIELLSKDSISVHQDPIDIAKDLITAEGEYERNSIEKTFCGTDKGTYHIFEISELRQIAEHLLVYCNANGEVEEC